MHDTIERYLDALKDELRDDEPALIQAAVTNTRTRLFMALIAAVRNTSDMSLSDAMDSVAAEHGSPHETISAYRAAQDRTLAAKKEGTMELSTLGRIFGVYGDPRTWRALLFMLLSLVTGIVYFTWAVTGLSLSLSFLILVIGVPFAILFLLSVRGLAWLEAWLVGALLGVGIESRPLFPSAAVNWLQRSKALLADKRTWLALLYLVLQMPLGVIYFTLAVTLLAVSLVLMAAPFLQVWLHFPVINIDNRAIFLPPEALALMGIGGLTLLTATMHLIRGVGDLHGRYAKALLVG